MMQPVEIGIDANHPHADWLWITPDPSLYITGGCALNLVDPYCGTTADWHQSGWRVADSGKPRAATHNTEFAIEGWEEIWTFDELFDAREALRDIRHPAADRPEPVWCASHVRAIIETCVDHITLCPHEESLTRSGLCADQINLMIGTFWQFAKLHWYASKVGRRLEGDRRREWHAWQMTLHPKRRYDTAHTVFWPIGYHPDGKRLANATTPDDAELDRRMRLWQQRSTDAPRKTDHTRP